jgi:hypothetical protein
LLIWEAALLLISEAALPLISEAALLLIYLGSRALLLISEAALLLISEAALLLISEAARSFSDWAIRFLVFSSTERFRKKTAITICNIPSLSSPTSRLTSPPITADL